jgi:hypothetical protein
LLLGSSNHAFMFLMRLPSLPTSAFSSSGTNGCSPLRPPPSEPIRLIRSSYEPALSFLLGACAGRRVRCSADRTPPFDCGQGLCVKRVLG